MADLKARIWDKQTARESDSSDLADFIGGVVRSELAKYPTAGGGQRIEVAFSDADLSISGVLVKEHNFGRVPAAVRIVDPNGDCVQPDGEADSTIDTVAVDLKTFRPLKSGQWKLILLG